MKCIDAIIRPSKLADVKQRIRQVGIKTMTVSEVTDCGGSDGRQRIYRGSSYVIDGVTKARVQITVEEEMVGPVVDAILATARPGEVDNGNISIYPVAEIIRIEVDARRYLAIADRHYDDAKVA